MQLATADTTPPVISLLGSSTINLTVGDTLTDPGVTATDDVDGDVTLSITASGIVDTSTAGTYVITYSVSDAAGNSNYSRLEQLCIGSSSHQSILRMERVNVPKQQLGDTAGD